MGNPLPTEVVRAAMLLRCNALCRGNSGIRLSTIETLLSMLNAGVHPIVPEKGSLGASGDLAPLSHMVLVMLGEGRAEYKGEIMSGREAMAAAGIPTVELAAKEGLALINGTQIMTAVGCLAVYDAVQLTKTADIACASRLSIHLSRKDRLTATHNGSRLKSRDSITLKLTRFESLLAGSLFLPGFQVLVKAVLPEGCSCPF